MCGAYLPGHLRAVDERQRVVDYGDIWFGLQRLLNRLLPVSRLSHHLPVRLSLNDMAQSRSDHIVVVCDQDSDHRGKLRRALTNLQGFPPPATAKRLITRRGSSHPGANTSCRMASVRQLPRVETSPSMRFRRRGLMGGDREPALAISLGSGLSLLDISLRDTALRSQKWPKPGPLAARLGVYLGQHCVSSRSERTRIPAYHKRTRSSQEPHGSSVPQ